MNNFKSSPLIQNTVKSRFTRKSRRISKQKLERQNLCPTMIPSIKIQEENSPTADIQNQMQQLGILMPSQAQESSYMTSQGRRRSSVFARHLEAMQSAARKQEQMYKYYICGETTECQGSDSDEMQEEHPMTIEQQDDISMGMRHCFLQIDDQPLQSEELNFFSEQEVEGAVMFFSQNNIEEQVSLNEDYMTYFNV